MSDRFAGASILVVDDERANVRLLERILRNAGFVNVMSTEDPRLVVDLFRTFEPDLVLLDLHMPQLDGFGVMRNLQQELEEETYLPIVVLTADITDEAKHEALAMGAKDFLTKPIDHHEVMLRINNLLETRYLYLELKKRNETLDRELDEARIEVADRLALAAEYRDDDTGEHTQRVGKTCALIARVMGIEPDIAELIRRAAPLHDVGKIGISDTILLKPGPLTADEFERMKTHTLIGAQILSGSGSRLLRCAETIALSHHERWDGSGYPYGVSRDGIPLPGRIVAVADVFDALTHDRPYKRAWTVTDAIAEIERQRGRQFDPTVVEAFLRGLGIEVPAAVPDDRRRGSAGVGEDLAAAN